MYVYVYHLKIMKIMIQIKFSVNSYIDMHFLLEQQLNVLN